MWLCAISFLKCSSKNAINHLNRCEPWSLAAVGSAIGMVPSAAGAPAIPSVA